MVCCATDVALRSLVAFLGTIRLGGLPIASGASWSGTMACERSSRLLLGMYGRMRVWRAHANRQLPA
jgi:hypothetical protein